MRDNKWVRLLAYVTGLVNQRLLLQNEYLIAENRILRAHLPTRLRLSDPERSTLAEIGKRLGRKNLELVASVALPDTILAWYRRLIAQKFDGSKRRSCPGRPPITPEIEALIVRMARENSGWGYDRIVGALANLGHRVSDQTVGNVLRRYGIPPAPKRSQKTTWKEFISAHMAVLTGIDFFTVEVLTWRAWPPITCCSSSNWRRAGSRLLASRATQRPSGCCRCPATRPMRNPAIFADNGTCFTTATRNSALPFAMYCDQRECGQSCCRSRARI
jgi:Homeodomain-like domain